jgi:hypothetical protein
MNEVIEAIHCQTDKPYYDGKKSWDSYEDIDHYREPRNDKAPMLVTLDIESDTEGAQKPIFVCVYDEEARKVYIGQDYRASPEELQDPEVVKDIVRDEFEPFESVTVEHTFNAEMGFIEGILKDIQEFNSHNEVQKGLCGHNVFFDLGLTGSPDASILEFDQVDDEWDGAISYNEWSLLHKRAGADGRLYGFRHKLKPEYIEVVDTMAVSKSIRMGASLEDVADNLDIDYIDVEDEEHGKLTEEYIRYNVNDVITTHKIAKRQREVINDNFSSNINLSKVFSSASISKEKMREMGYNRTHYEEEAMGICSSAYYGGQTECLTAGDKVEGVDYTDILSQYPTGCALTNVWKYMRAERVWAEEVDVEKLPTPSIEDFKNPKTWEDVEQYYVMVEAKNAKLPIRTQAGDTNTTSVYKGRITTNESVTYHYMDVLGALMYGEGEIEIKKAFQMKYEGEQELEDVEIGGTEIDANDNLMKRIIEERKRIQKQNREAGIGNAEGKNEDTLALKIIANSLYGVSAERLVEQSENKDGIIKRHDKAGTFYNPHTATTITASGRLMLTIGEIIALENGGDFHYCDTDSLIIDNSVSDEVRNYFNENLNPYDGQAGELDVLEIEVEDDLKLENVTYFGWDVKKYCILDKEDNIIMKKQHGLGHYSTFQGSEGKKRTKQFWASLMKQVGFDTATETLPEEVLNEYVSWQSSASTEVVRKRMSDLIGEQVRYGDFLERTISVEDGNIVIYCSTSLDMDNVIKITRTAEDQAEIEVVDSIDKTNLKTVDDVLDQWSLQGAEGGRNAYEIVGIQKVTKEATDIVDLWDSVIFTALESTKDIDFDLFNTNKERKQKAELRKLKSEDIHLDDFM